MKDINTLTIFTKALLNKGLDYEVTLAGSKVTVRLFEQMSSKTIGVCSSESLEDALANVLAETANDNAQHFFHGLSRL